MSVEHGGRPRGELSSYQHTQPQQADPQQGGSSAETPLAPILRERQGGEERSHEELVEAFRNAILRRQHEWKERGENPSPAQIIQSELFHEAQFRFMSDREEYGEYKQRGEFYFPILKAWDVIAYGHYGKGPVNTGSAERHSAGLNLSRHYQQTRQTTVMLSEPQMRILDALAEAADIPHQKGQAEIDIPKKLRNYENQLK